MGIIKTEHREEEFNGTIYTLTCNKTDKKLINILVKKDNDELDEPVFCNIKATSPFFPGSDSGTHKIGGLLSFGPIDQEESDSPTVIEDMDFNTIEDQEICTIYIGKG